MSLCISCLRGHKLRQLWYMLVPPLLCLRFPPGVIFIFRVTRACPVTTDYIMPDNMRTTTYTTCLCYFIYCSCIAANITHEYIDFCLWYFRRLLLLLRHLSAAAITAACTSEHPPLPEEKGSYRAPCSVLDGLLCKKTLRNRTVVLARDEEYVPPTLFVF